MQRGLLVSAESYATTMLRTSPDPALGRQPCEQTGPGAAGLSAVSSCVRSHRQLVQPRPVCLSQEEARRRGPGWRLEGTLRSELTGSTPRALQPPAPGEGCGDETAEMGTVHSNQNSRLCVQAIVWWEGPGYMAPDHIPATLSGSLCVLGHLHHVACAWEPCGDIDRPGGQPAPEPELLLLPMPMGQ